MSEEFPALLAARNSWKCVHAHDKQGWLALMADDVCIEDPIGVAPPTNPDGKGIRGKSAVSEFWDKHIGPSKISIETHESHSTAYESAHVLTLTTTLSNGVVTKVRSIFTYEVDDDGKLTSLRGYWHLGVMEFTQPS